MSEVKLVQLIKRHPRAAVAGAAVAVVLLLAAAMGSRHPTSVDLARDVDYPVRRGPLTISIDEGGTIVSRERHIVATDLSDDTTFSWLIPEGAEVQQGDLLAELDNTLFARQKEELEIQLIANRSEVARAENELKVITTANEAEVSRAEVDYKLAEMELKKYQEGDYPQALRQLESDISIAREELQRAEDVLEGTRRLHDRGFITGSELQADMLAAKRAQIRLDLATSAREIYETYTHEQELETRMLDVGQKRLTLERVKHQATSKKQFAETALANQRAQLQHRESRLEQVEKDLRGCKVTAPADGMVIYASTVRRGRNYSEPFAVGREVDERQDLFYIPSSGLRNAELTVHESELEMVEVGMPARVEVEAVPNVVFPAKVSAIAVMPRQDDQWSNPNLKEFPVEVELDSDDDRLRTGMSCRVEIVVHRYDDVHYVPVQAVVQHGGEPVTYVRDGEDVQRRPVDLGLRDNRMVAVLAGLEQGEQVLLSPPLAEDPDPEGVRQGSAAAVTSR